MYSQLYTYFCPSMYFKHIDELKNFSTVNLHRTFPHLDLGVKYTFLYLSMWGGVRITIYTAKINIKVRTYQFNLLFRSFLILTGALVLF